MKQSMRSIRGILISTGVLGAGCAIAPLGTSETVGLARSHLHASPPEGEEYEIRNFSANLCLDSWGREGTAQMWSCHGLGGNQAWRFDPKTHELKNAATGLCLQDSSMYDIGTADVAICHGQGGRQAWAYTSTHELKNVETGRCLDSWGRAGDATIYGCHGLKGNQEFRLLKETWDFCALEGSGCIFAGRMNVAYGEGRFTSNYSTNEVECDNSVFGDPARGVEKACWLRVRQEPNWSGVESTPFPVRPVAGITNPILSGAMIEGDPKATVADPFMFRDGDNWYLFFEYQPSNRNGRIGLAISQDGLHWQYDSVVLAEDFHLSYPQVFAADGNYYMIPEAHQTKTVRIYQAKNFPYDWKSVDPVVLVSGRAFVDASIIRHLGTWWLFAGDTTNANTYLYYSDNLLSGWSAHPSSPIISRDAGWGRPGGRVVSIGTGQILRFVQKDNLTYGQMVRATQIDTLTKTQFAEHHVSDTPIVGASGQGWNADGMHHFDPWWTGSEWRIVADGVEHNVWSIGIYSAAP